MQRPFVFLVGASEEPRTRITVYARHELHAKTLCKLFLEYICGKSPPREGWNFELLRGFE